MSEILINGIYDSRTLMGLQLEGIKNFSFDFNPKSQSFIQEYVFLSLLKNITTSDFIFLKFKNNEDYFINRIIQDINNSGISKLQFIFIFEEVTTQIEKFEFAFLTYYNSSMAKHLEKNPNFIGIIFHFKELERLFLENTLSNFYNNLFLVFNNFSNLKIGLDINWNDSIISAMNDLFEFNYFVLNINSYIEVCYRNVNLVKLKAELNFKKIDIIL